MPLTISELAAANSSRVKRWHSIDAWSPLEWAGAMAGGAGEACNAAKKLKRIDDGIANINCADRSLTDRLDACKKIGLEIADTIIYGVLLAESVGVDLEQCIIEAFNRKSEEYGFPERIGQPTHSILATNTNTNINSIPQQEAAEEMMQNRKHKEITAGCICQRVQDSILLNRDCPVHKGEFQDVSL